MEKINFQNNVTKANAETMTQFQNNIESAINEILNSVCPIGKIEIFFDNDDHSNYLGFTWERTLIGKTPVGIDSSDNDFNEIGKTGGEKEHTLIIPEIPSHNHSRGYSTLTFYGADGEGVIVSPNFCSAGDKTQNYYNPIDIGNNQPHNNMQPYEVVAYWIRVS